MNKFLSVISDIRIIAFLITVVVLLTAWLIATQIRTKRHKNDLAALEGKYTTIKNVPLFFKMNKAVAISRVDQETVDKVEKAKKDYEKAQADLKQISDDLANAEDCILVGKLKKADVYMKALEPLINDTHREVKNLDILLDDILAKETAQRQEGITLKNRFRAIRASAQENASRLSYNWATIEQKLDDTDKMFATFEEWMLSSDFEKANAELDMIRRSMSDLEKMIDTMPALLEDARGVIPSMAETLHRDYLREKNRGVFVKHLNIETNLAALTASLKEDLKLLKVGRQDGVGAHLDDYKVRLGQMDEAVRKEGEAYDEMRSLTKETEKLADEVNGDFSYLSSKSDEALAKYGISNMTDVLEEADGKLAHLNGLKPEVISTVRAYSSPASEVLVSLKQLNQDYSEIGDKLHNMRKAMDDACSDEDRAKKQLLKLQIIMNQMQVKIRKYKLPNISHNYQEDMAHAEDYIAKLQGLMNASPLNIQTLNATLQEALDFIYKLFNNVNNVCGTVVMVENTIVFGNRYRSTYPDIDDELTRSELNFRNGEYTAALQTAISTVEKIHPGNYESVIKENADSAA